MFSERAAAYTKFLAEDIHCKIIGEQMSVHKILSMVQSTSSAKEKKELLHLNKDNEALKSIFYLSSNSKKYHLKQVPDSQTEGDKTVDRNIKALTNLCNKLNTRELSGNDAKSVVKDFLSNFTFESQGIITKVIKKDLKIGCGATLINTIWNNLIPTFNVALGYDIVKAANVDIYDGSWLVSRKLDGCRCITIFGNSGKISFYSREGLKFFTFENLRAELATLNLAGAVFDGEICIVKNGKEDFSGIMSEIRKKDHTIENPKYFLFDLLSHDEFSSQTSTSILSARLSKLNSLIPKGMNHVSVLKQRRVTPKVFEEMEKEVSKNGWEGLIVRKDAPYKGKKSKDLLKVKKFFDAEYKVVDTVNDIMSFTEKGKGQFEEETFKSATIMHKGNVVDVGGGWSREERREFFEDPNKIIGKVITVKYFEESENKKTGAKSLRFPTKVVIHGKSRVV